jgi:hypothetical protein
MRRNEHFVPYLECPLPNLSLARRVHIYIYIYIEARKKPNTKNYDQNEKSNFVYGKYHTCRKGKKEKKKQHEDIHIYEKRKEVFMRSIH